MPQTRFELVKAAIEEIAADLESAKATGDAAAARYDSERLQDAARLGTLGFRVENAAFRLRSLLAYHFHDQARQEVDHAA